MELANNLKVHILTKKTAHNCAVFLGNDNEVARD